jgi:hypothetical protein
LRDPVLLAQAIRGVSLLTRGHHFFCDVLEHRLVQHQLGHQELEPLDLDLQFTAAAFRVDPGGIVALAPARLRRLGDAELSADVPNGQTLGPVAIGLPK